MTEHLHTSLHTLQDEIDPYSPTAGSFLRSQVESMEAHGISKADHKRPYFYLAGPMSHIPKFNFPAFHLYAERLRGNGYNIVSPAELDTQIEHDAAMASPDGEHDPSNPNVKTWAQCLIRDVRYVTDDLCEGIFAMPGWERSRGARFETFVAQALSKPIHEVFTFEHLEVVAPEGVTDGMVYGMEIDRDEALAKAGTLSDSPAVKALLSRGF